MTDELNKKVDEGWKERIDKEKSQAGAPMPDSADKRASNEAPAESNFSMFISGLALQVLMQLGEIPNPVTKKKEKELEQAKYLIDILAMLKEKTANNLTKEEARLFEDTLYDLRMRFVTAAKG